jgi:inosose dehydratase
MERNSHNSQPRASWSIAERLAGAPISWGVSEQAGWGAELPPERVLSEMAALGLRATELGPVGYLPLDGTRLRDLLHRHGLTLVAAFAPLVLHERPDAGAREIESLAGRVVAAGGELISVAPVVDEDWSPRIPLTAAQWSRLIAGLDAAGRRAREYGLTVALHPHAGSLVQEAAEIDRVLEHSDLPWCVDTGHMLIGGMDPAAFAREHGDRVAHVHLKDVDLGLAGRVGRGDLSLGEGVRRGLFRPLGAGDAPIAEVVAVLAESGYRGWLVLEQDAALAAPPAPGEGPARDVGRSIDFLRRSVPALEREEART